MGMEISDDLVSIGSGVFECCKLFFGIHGEVFSAGVYVCEKVDFGDGDLLGFFGSCEETAGFIWEAGSAVVQDGVVVLFFYI